MEREACRHGKDKKACVSLVPIFNHLEQEQMKEIMQVVQSISLKKDDMMYHAGKISDSLYIVHRGQVKIYRLAESGKEQLVRILNPGDFTGELALFQDSIHEAFAEAMVDSDVCMIQRDDLHHLLMKYPTISLRILTEFSNRLDLSERQTTQFATEKVELRIAHYLVECLEKAEQKNVEIELPMSKKNLASYLGTTAETLSRRLSDFEAKGLIKQTGQRKIVITDLDRLLLV